MKRVAIVIGSLSDGGAEKQSVMLARALRHDHDVTFIVLKEHPCAPKHLAALRDAGVVPIFASKNPVTRPFDVRRILRTSRPAVLFSYLPGDTAMAAFAGRLAGVPVIVGGIRNSEIAGWKWRILRFLHNHVLDRSISNASSAARSFAGLGFDPRKLIVIPNGIEISQPPITRPKSDCVRILSVGRFVDQKDYGTALSAVAAMKRRLPSGVRFTYAIAGHGPLEAQIRRSIADHGLLEQVEIHANVSDAGDLYRSSDICLSTSRFEGLSNVILEAMLHSLPIVATDVGDNHELVRHGYSGYLEAPGAAEDLAQRLCELIESHETRLQLGQRGYEIVSDRYSLASFQARYLQLVEELT